METKTINPKRNQNKKIIIGILSAVCVLLAIYLSIAFFFSGHFRVGTRINGVDASYKTVQQVKKEIVAKASDYQIKLINRQGESEIIKGSDIEYRYEIGKEIENLKKKQSPYGWIEGFFRKQIIELKEEVKYDEDALDEAINNLKCLNSENIVEPKNATLVLKAGEFIVTPEEHGNKLDIIKVKKGIKASILNSEEEINFEELGYYEEPKVVSTSKEITEAKAKLDKYMNTNISINFQDKKEVINGLTISNWINIDENYKVLLNNDYVEAYVDNLASMYNTYGITRQFATSLGTTVSVAGGDYGWILNKEDMIVGIEDAVENGKAITIDATYNQAAASRSGNDFGNTYVEINLTTQQIWYYKNGNLITSGNCVTGTANTQYATPQGTYVLKYLDRDAILRGPGYEAPVTFWMPFNWDIGLHDATWRGSFGGTIYQYDGSHGCVNLPYDIAEAIFNNIEAGTAVICYY